MDELTIAFKIETPPSWLPIGRTAENNWRTVEIDCSYWFNMNADGEVVLMYKPSCGMSPYPLLTERDGDNIIWRPKSGELVAGVGKLQAFFEVGADVIGSSDMVSCEVDSSLLGADPGTDPGQTDLPWALDIIEQIAELSGHYPKIIDGNLYIWDSTLNDWVEFDGGGSGGGEDVFIAVRGTTTEAEIREAHGAGKVIICVYDNRVYYLSDVQTVMFSTAPDAQGKVYLLIVIGSRWSGITYNFALKSDIPSLSAYRTASAQDEIDSAQNTAIAAKYTKPSGGIPASDLAAGVIPTVPQMATQTDMSDWTSGKTVDAAVLKTDFLTAAGQISYVTDELGNKANRTEIPTKTSDLTNDSGFVTAQQAAAVAPVQSVNGKTGAVVLDASDVGALPDSTVIPTVPAAEISANTAARHTHSNKALLDTYEQTEVNLADAVAKKHSHSNKSVLDGISTNDVSAWNAKYSKPSGGIPKSDLASAVQTSLGKADTALQSHQSLSAYRTASAQDTIDAGKLGVSENAYRSASIPMGHVDSTSTATAFTATVPGITELRDGVCMWLRNGVITSASGFTININGLGAKPCYSSLSAESRSTTIFNANYTMLLIYNSTRVEGGCWDIVYGVDTNTTYTPPKLGFGYAVCTTAAATAAKTASISSYALTAGGIVSIKFDNDVPANATLNITSKGAKAIYHRGAAITAGVIKGGDTATFIYSTYYHLISIDRWGEDIADLDSRLDALTILDEEVF